MPEYTRAAINSQNAHQSLYAPADEQWQSAETSGPASSYADVLSLQRTVGNRAVSQSVQADAYSRSNAAASPARTPLLPSVRGDDRRQLLEVMSTIQSVQPSPVASGLYSITIDGQTRSISYDQLAQAQRSAKSAIREALGRVGARAAGVQAGYEALSATEREHWVVAPIVKFLGGVRDPNPFLMRELQQAGRSAAAAFQALERDNFVGAAHALAEAEAAATSAGKMWQAYFQGIIGASEMTVTVLEYTRNAAFITLGVLATIGTAGAAAGATPAIGLELGGSATAINAVAFSAPVIAELGNAGTRAALGDQVDWGEVAVNTAVQIILTRFGGKLADGLFKQMVGNATVRSIGRQAFASVVSSTLSGGAGRAFNTTVQSVYQKLRGRKVTWDQFTDQLVAQMIDPRALVIDALMGGVQQYARSRYSVPGGTPPEPSAPAPAQSEHGASVTPITQGHEIRAARAAVPPEAVPMEQPLARTGTDDLVVQPGLEIEVPATTGSTPIVATAGGLGGGSGTGGITPPPSNVVTFRPAPSAGRTLATPGSAGPSAAPPTRDADVVPLRPRGTTPTPRAATPASATATARPVIPGTGSPGGARVDVSTNYRYRTYAENGFTYHEATGPLGHPDFVVQHRSPSAQRGVAGGTGDDAGHLIGNQFGASGTAENLALQNRPANQFGTWKNLEMRWAARLRRGVYIEARVTDITRPGESRPYMRRAEWVEIAPNGVRTTHSEVFANNYTSQGRRLQSVPPTVTSPQSDNVLSFDPHDGS